MLGTESLHGIIRIRIEFGGGMGISPPDKRHPRTVFVFVLVFVLVLVLVLVLQQAATYSIAAVTGN